MSDTIKGLLDGNKRWLKTIQKHNPDFLEQLSKEQSPETLWIGCSDSRVPATEITGALPGSIFVQRNVANLVVHTDANLLSVVFYAVKVLKVKHVVVCGHYGCGGVEAAMSNNNYGFIDNWLLHIKDVYRTHQHELDAIKSKDARLERFVELNIIEQVSNLSKVSFVQDLWKTGEFPYIHGWVYSLKDGLIRDLKVSRNNSDDLEKVYRFDFNK